MLMTFRRNLSKGRQYVTFRDSQTCVVLGIEGNCHSSGGNPVTVPVCKSGGLSTVLTEGITHSYMHAVAHHPSVKVCRVIGDSQCALRYHVMSVAHCALRIAHCVSVSAVARYISCL
jgi:hypothetical protein